MRKRADVSEGAGEFSLGKKKAMGWLLTRLPQSISCRARLAGQQAALEKVKAVAFYRFIYFFSLAFRNSGKILSKIDEELFLLNQRARTQGRACRGSRQDLGAALCWFSSCNYS